MNTYDGSRDRLEHSTSVRTQCCVRCVALCLGSDLHVCLKIRHCVGRKHSTVSLCRASWQPRRGSSKQSSGLWEPRKPVLSPRPVDPGSSDRPHPHSREKHSSAPYTPPAPGTPHSEPQEPAQRHFRGIPHSEPRRHFSPSRKVHSHLNRTVSLALARQPESAIPDSGFRRAHAALLFT